MWSRRFPPSSARDSPGAHDNAAPASAVPKGARDSAFLSHRTGCCPWDRSASRGRYRKFSFPDRNSFQAPPPQTPLGVWMRPRCFYLTNTCR